jgi:hypothetical protein
MNVNELMNMNDMYYVGNIYDTDGDGWVTKAEAQAILDELVNDSKMNGYGDETAEEWKRMMATVGVRV